MSKTKSSESSTLTAAAKARRALAVYLRKGYESITALENQKIDCGAMDRNDEILVDKVLEKLAERDAAFANFQYHDRSADHIRTRSTEIDQMLVEAQAQNERLKALIGSVAAICRGGLGQINNARQVTRLYRSGQEPEARFRKTT